MGRTSRDTAWAVNDKAWVLSVALTVVAWGSGLVVGFIAGLISKVVEVEAGGTSLLGQHDEGQEPDKEELGAHDLVQI